MLRCWLICGVCFDAGGLSLSSQIINCLSFGLSCEDC